LDAVNVTMSDTLPNYTSLFSVTSTRGTCSQSGRIATCVIDTLTAGEKVTVTVVAKALIGGTITNHASVSQTEIDYISENNIAYQSTEVKSFIGHDLEQGYKPSIATDQNNKAHMTYNTFDQNLVYQTNSSGAWTYELVDSSGFITESAIAVDNNDVVHIAYVFFDWDPDLYPGNAIYFGNTVQGQDGCPSFQTVTKSETETYLKIRREGNLYSGYYSPDGITWTLTGQHIAELESISIGLFAGQSGVTETADFDYFLIETLP
jgi:hypothetical protein